MKAKRLILAGGSGFLGQLLARHFAAQSWEVVILTRNPQTSPKGSQCRSVLWDGRTVGPWADELDGADALINLAGRSVNCRYNKRNQAAIMSSRTESTRTLAGVVAACAHPPPVWLNASTATIYRHTFGAPWDEAGEIAATPEAKDAFSIEVAEAWERVFGEAHVPAIRKMALRTAMVFGLDDAHNNVFHVLRRLARWGLGGRMGHGQQFVSWIHELDFCRAVEFVIERSDVEGVVNLAAPNPIANHEMMQIFRDLSGRFIGLPAALWMLEAGAFLLRTETELIIKSRRVVPGKLMEAGFSFRFQEMRAAIEDLTGKIRRASV